MKQLLSFEFIITNIYMFTWLSTVSAAQHDSLNDVNEDLLCL